MTVLFRAKKIDNDEWVIGYVTRIRRSDKKGNAKSYYFNALSEQGWVAECVVSAETVCQYTGLDDKNGNKIFEGDIVLVNGEDGCFAVGWDNDNAGFVMGNDSFRVSFFGYWGYQVEVVGNIFDNPELIGGERNEKRHD